MQPVTLVCMRLDRMRARHPRQDDSHVCSSCGERVGVYPAGQKLIASGFPGGVKVVCSVCARPAIDLSLDRPVPGALEDVAEAMRSRNERDE